jgi:hypothetical protein
MGPPDGQNQKTTALLCHDRHDADPSRRTFELVYHLAFPLAATIAGSNVPFDHSIPENRQGVQHADAAQFASTESMPRKASQTYLKFQHQPMCVN